MLLIPLSEGRTCHYFQRGSATAFVPSALKIFFYSTMELCTRVLLACVMLKEYGHCYYRHSRYDCTWYTLNLNRVESVANHH